ncbi:hypothetical protein [Leuconostoc pseudomesenteroides]|uniref:hypothetical protein n=1 Tax=Leuconostoc pseudomesenteroides TaxID=33968 RepID=UPI0039EA21F2
MPNRFILSRKGGGIVMFDVDEAYSVPNQMISGETGQGKSYYVNPRIGMMYAIRHPFVAIKILFSLFKGPAY